jgi:anti-sigma factor RsiW
MECKQAIDLMSAYLDDVLDKNSRESLRQHLSLCHACRKELEALQTVMKNVRSLNSLQAPPDFLGNLHGRIQEIETESRLKRLLRFLFFPIRIKVPVEVMSITAVAVIIFSVFHNISPQELMPTAAKVSQQSTSPQDHVVKEDASLGSGGAQAPEKALAKSEEKGAQTGLPHKSTGGTKPLPAPALNRAQAPAVFLGKNDQSIPPAEKQAIELSLMVRAQLVSHEEKAVAEERTHAKAEMQAKDSSGAMSTPAAPQMAYEAEDRSAQMEKERKKAVANSESALQKRGEPLFVTRIQDCIGAVHGSLVSIEYEAQTDQPRLITARIPGNRLNDFYHILEGIAEIKTPPKSQTEPDQTDRLVKLHIVIEEPLKQ